MLMNTAFVFVLIAGNLDVVTGGRRGNLSRLLDTTNLMSGTISDFTSEWYLQVNTHWDDRQDRHTIGAYLVDTSSHKLSQVCG